MFSFNFTYPLRCLRVPQVEYHWFITLWITKLPGFFYCILFRKYINFFRTLDLFPSSGEKVVRYLLVGSIRNSRSQSTDLRTEAGIVSETVSFRNLRRRAKSTNSVTPIITFIVLITSTVNSNYVLYIFPRG
jgi:hypothetical protein